ncbi:DNA topoisomerase IB [Roseivivax isoporae]|uniref:DNA topoisomerase n=1 Tax=Roseivivax isoporae LMG 25204 TaxID=1449351 RepID=X7F7W4_9RHOB|nr:DNA topoisomerase IB [Roseivivax isoporae]ETX28997.1 DNA topoisomerase [Roseivivax isoporae LMG 25204]
MARLLYYPDDRPGITRRRRGRGFSYYAPGGALIRDADERARIDSLAVPPAYADVWISPKPHGHLQATGRDARGRKQYRYHADWLAQRDRRKFEGLAAFGRTLPRIRARIARGLAAEAGSRDLALSAVLALIDRSAIRIGAPGYVRENDSYGATTLRDEHVSFDENGVEIAFPGKRGTPVTCRLRGRRLERALQQVHDLPGGDLMSWQDDDGAVHTVRSEEVNALLHDCCGEDMTAKTFRTWNGTLAAFAEAMRPGPLRIADMTGAAAARLHNTPAIARKSYVHPAVIALAELPEGERAELLAALDPADPGPLRAHEGALITFLERHAGLGAT